MKNKKKLKSELEENPLTLCRQNMKRVESFPILAQLSMKRVNRERGDQIVVLGAYRYLYYFVRVICIINEKSLIF